MTKNKNNDNNLSKGHGRLGEVMQKVCSKCKMNIQDVLDSGIVGCKECYVEFREELLPIIKDIQKSTQNLGKKAQKDHFDEEIEQEIQDILRGDNG